MTTTGFTNLSEFLKGVKDGVKRMENALDAGLYAVGNNILAKSNETAPIDTGVMRGSAYATLPKDHEVEIGYGGPAAKYVIVQHEDTRLRHKPGEAAKFLQNALNIASATYVQDVQAVAAAAFQAGGNTLPTGEFPTRPGMKK